LQGRIIELVELLIRHTSRARSIYEDP